MDARVGTRRGKAVPRPKREGSPYFGKPVEEWAHVTRGLLAQHPLPGPTLVSAVLDSWNSIFQSTLGSGFHIGKDIFPAPQTMGFLLHELIPLELAKNSPNWRADKDATDKDLVYIPDIFFSIEIKTSSHKDQIFGNRSFGVEGGGRGKKAKDGFYATVNFERWEDASLGSLPEIRLVKYGWLDHTDWVAQSSETGQQSSLPPAVANNQLLTLYCAEGEESHLFS